MLAPGQHTSCGKPQRFLPGSVSGFPGFGDLAHHYFVPVAGLGMGVFHEFAVLRIVEVAGRYGCHFGEFAFYDELGLFVGGIAIRCHHHGEIGGLHLIGVTTRFHSKLHVVVAILLREEGDIIKIVKWRDALPWLKNVG